MIALEKWCVKILILLPFICWHNSTSGQNLHHIDVYPTFEYYTRVYQINDGTKLISTCSQKNIFYPNKKDITNSIENSDDAYLIWETMEGDYLRHVSLKGSGTIIVIQHCWVIKNNNILALISVPNTDTLTIFSHIQETRILPVNKNRRNTSYFLVKFDKNGTFQKSVLLSEGGKLDYPKFSSDEIFFEITTGATTPIAGGVDTLYGIGTAEKKGTFVIKTDDMSFGKISIYPQNLESLGGDSTGAFFGNNATWAYNLDSGNRIQIWYNFKDGSFSSSLLGSQATKIRSAVSFNDTLFAIITARRIGSTDTVLQLGDATFTVPPFQSVLTKWINGKLVNQSDNYIAGLKVLLSVDELNHLYCYGTFQSNTSNNLSTIYNPGFMYKQRYQKLVGNHCFYWGKIESDSFLWLRILDGSGASYGVNEFTATFSKDFQFVVQKLVGSVDWDPGSYFWQYEIPKFQGQPIVATYGCKPHAIFTYQQNKQKFHFINQSDGADSFYWDFGADGETSKERNPVFEYSMTGEYNVTLIAFNQCGSDTFQFPVYVDEMGSVQPIVSNAFKIYPNPCSTYLKIDNYDPSFEFDLFDIRGRRMLNREISNEGIMDVSQLPNGTYILRCRQQNAIYTELILKK